MIVSSFAVTSFSWSVWTIVSSWVMTMPSFNKQSRKSKTWDSTSRLRATQQIMWESVSRNFATALLEFIQRALIDSIIKEVGISNSKTKPVSAKVSL
jgi:hypothetical protein